MKLLVVIVNYNGFRLTADCLDAVARMVHEVPGTQVGVCDNGSQPGEARRLADFIVQRGYTPWCTLTAIAPNLGFCGGNNAVIRPALASDDPPDFVLLLNNDTLPYPGALRTLVDFMASDAAHASRVGCVGSRLEDLPASHPTARDWLDRGGAHAEPGAAQVSAFRFFSVLNEFQQATQLGPVYRLLRRFAVGMKVPQADTPVDWVSGASLMIRREVMDAVGPLDDRYYTYFDDIDYARSAAKAGYTTWYVPGSRVVHLVGQTTGVSFADNDAAEKAKRATKPRPAYWFQARHRYWLKHHGKTKAALADLALISGTAIHRVRSWFGGQDQGVPARYLRDAWKTSVFRTGFAVPHVMNPDLGEPNPLEPTVIDPYADDADLATPAESAERPETRATSAA